MNTRSICRWDKVIPDVRIIDQVGHRIRLGVNVYEHPEALIFKGTHSGDLHSQVCGECGYVEIYVENPRELYAVYMESQGEWREMPALGRFTNKKIHPDLG